MKTFIALIGLVFFVQPDSPKGEFNNEHFILPYPEEWIVRPVEATSKVNLILESEKFSIWSPLKPNEDRKLLKLTIPSTIYYKRKPSIKKLNKEIWKGAKSKFEEFERVSTEEGIKDQVPYIKTVFTHKIGFGYETTEYYVFSVANTPYVLYMTSSRKEHLGQKAVWGKIWSDLIFQ